MSKSRYLTNHKQYVWNEASVGYPMDMCFLYALALAWKEGGGQSAHASGFSLAWERGEGGSTPMQVNLRDGDKGQSPSCGRSPVVQGVAVLCLCV